MMILVDVDIFLNCKKMFVCLEKSSFAWTKVPF